MGSVLSLVLATPVFGFALALDPGVALDVATVAAVAPASMAAAEVGDPGPTPAEQMEQRARIADVHRWLGVSTFSVMTVTVAAGIVQYRNLYGGGTLGETPCVQGDAWPSQSTCTGHPVGHLTLGLLTGALYFTTFGLSFAMPDPYGASEGQSGFARRLRAHKALRWVHFSGMIAQMVLGVVVANGDRFGLDRANDYGTLRALAGVHLGVGALTYASLGAAGALMLF